MGQGGAVDVRGIGRPIGRAQTRSDRFTLEEFGCRGSLPLLRSTSLLGVDPFLDLFRQSSAVALAVIAFDQQHRTAVGTVCVTSTMALECLDDCFGIVQGYLSPLSSVFVAPQSLAEGAVSPRTIQDCIEVLRFSNVLLRVGMLCRRHVGSAVTAL